MPELKPLTDTERTKLAELQRRHEAEQLGVLEQTLRGAAYSDSIDALDAIRPNITDVDAAKILTDLVVVMRHQRKLLLARIESLKPAA